MYVAGTNAIAMYVYGWSRMTPANDVHLLERISIQRCRIAHFDKGVRQREDEHPFGTKSSPRRSRLVHSTSELFIALVYQTIHTFWY